MPGGAQKLTAQLVDADGRVVGYLKCAEQPLARERLRHEHELLRSLPKGAGPEPLAYGCLAGLEVMLLAPVHGRHPPSALRPSSALYDFADSLTTAELHPLEQHPWYREHAATVPAMVPKLDALASRPWPVAFAHGDLAPWNLLQTASGGLLALDWEYGTMSGLPGLDVAQYVLQVALLLARRRADLAREDAARALAAIATPRLSAPERDALVAIAAHAAHHAAAREGLSDDDPRQRWRRAVWSRERA
jgi:hypothetical protein